MNILKYIGSFLMIGAMLIVLPGFKRKSSPLQIPNLPAMEESADYTETKQGITLQAKRLSKPEAEQILGKRAERLWRQSRLRITRRRKGQRTHRSRKTEQIIPIQLSIKNQTNGTVTIGPENIKLQLIDGKTVAKRLQGRPFFAAIGTLIVGIVIFGTLAVGASLMANALAIGVKWGGIETAVLNALFVGTVACVSGMVFFTVTTPIVTTYKAVRITRENRRVRKTIDKNSFADKLHVASKQSIDTLIFVAEDDYKETFNINAQKNDGSSYASFKVSL